MSNVFLTGNTTTLRPLSVDDVPLLTKWINNEETRRYLNRRFPLADLDEKAWVEKSCVLSRAPSDIVMIIESKEDKCPIGTMGLHSINWVDRNAVTGTILGEKKFHGKGYASDAKMTLLKYAFETLGMHKIISYAFAKNTKSIEYSKRCGYAIEATLKEELFHEGAWEDMTVLACFYEDWKKASQHLQQSKPTI
jgi:RimJ/RimL family protein N-acetyltransferase